MPHNPLLLRAVTLCGQGGWTPLIHAAHMGNHKCIEVLLRELQKVGLGSPQQELECGVHIASGPLECISRLDRGKAQPAKHGDLLGLQALPDPP